MATTQQQQQRRPVQQAAAPSSSTQAAQQPGGPISEQKTPSKGSQLEQQEAALAPKAPEQPKAAAPAKEEPKAAVPAEPKSTGLANYEDTLGSFLGSKLYKAVRPQVSEDKLAKAANSAVKSGFKALGKQIQSADEDADPAAVDAFVNALVSQFGSTAGDWLKGEGAGIPHAMQGFVDDNPEVVAGLALLAAAGAVAANMEIPEIGKDFGLGHGFDAGMSVRLGRIRDLALEKIEAKLRYQSSQITGTFKATWEDDKMGAGLDLSYKPDEDVAINLNGKWDEDKGSSVNLGVDYKPRKNLSIGAHAGWSQDKGSNVGIGVKWSF